MSNLTAKLRAFVVEYLVDMNGAQAAIRAGYSPKSAKHIAYQNLHRPDVVAAIDRGMAERMQRVQLDADQVITMHRLVAEADPNELVEYRRGCCRYCYGLNHRYQRTPAEHAKDLGAWMHAYEGKDLPFDEQGGIGWNPKREPVADCPECFGDGVAELFVHDTRNLTPAARRLFAGVKETKDGLQILFNSQDKARELLGQHLGLFKNVIEFDPPPESAKPANVDWLGHPIPPADSPRPE